MGEPAWKTPPGGSGEPDDDSTGTVLLQRVVERPDGRLELAEWPPTLEDYLNPRLGDKLIQGRLHSDLCHLLYMEIRGYFRPDADVLVLQDVQIRLGPAGPSPDVSVIRGARNPKPDLESFDVVEQGVLPCLLIEVLSPRDPRVRHMDEVDKKSLYESVGIPEYLLVDTPRRATRHRFRIYGYRLGLGKRYRPIEPDPEERVLSETTGLRFGVSRDGKRIEVFDPAGERILTPDEAWEKAVREEEARKAQKAAERRAAQEAKARKAAESEVVRLRAEIERLKKQG
jgi:Uma2 family endonuclease